MSDGTLILPRKLENPLVKYVEILSLVGEGRLFSFIFYRDYVFKHSGDYEQRLPGRVPQRTATATELSELRLRSSAFVTLSRTAATHN